MVLAAESSRLGRALTALLLLLGAGPAVLPGVCGAGWQPTETYGGILNVFLPDTRNGDADISRYGCVRGPSSVAGWALVLSPSVAAREPGDVLTSGLSVARLGRNP